MSKPNVFIIESLDLEDEKKSRYEGMFLSQILNLSGKKSKYYYIRTKRELKEILPEFDKSQYRYLHLSCHGNKSSLSTMFDVIRFADLGDILRPHLKKRRLFVSGCSMVDYPLAGEIFRKPGCISLIGPKNDIDFDDAAITWASFYHLMFKRSSESMKRTNIENTIKTIEATFGVSLSYFARKSKGGFKKIR